jgi:hypothetical protein
VVATVVDTLRDLGVPAVAGAVVGAAITHFAAKSRGREDHERTLDLLVTQDERRTAGEMLVAVRRMKNRLNEGKVIFLGGLHNEWSDHVLAPSRLIRSDDLGSRARAGGSVIFNATRVPRDAEYTDYAVLRAALDVEEWLEASLKREPPPTAHLPPDTEVQAMMLRDEKVTFEPLNEHLQRRA